MVFTCFNPKIWVISTIPPHIYLYIRLVCLKNKNYMWTPKQSPNSARPHRPHRPHAHIVAPTVAAALGMAARHAGHESLVSVFHRCPVWLKKLKIKATRLGFKCDSCDILWLYWDSIRDIKNGIEYDFDIWFTVNKQDWDITGAIRNIICKWWILCSYVDLLGGTQGLINRWFLNRGGIDKCW